MRLPEPLFNAAVRRLESYGYFLLSEQGGEVLLGYCPTFALVRRISIRAPQDPALRAAHVRLTLAPSGDLLIDFAGAVAALAQVGVHYLYPVGCRTSRFAVFRDSSCEYFILARVRERDRLWFRFSALAPLFDD